MIPPLKPIRPRGEFWNSTAQQEHVLAVVQENPIREGEGCMSYVRRIAIATGMMAPDAQPARQMPPAGSQRPSGDIVVDTRTGEQVQVVAVETFTAELLTPEQERDRAIAETLGPEPVILPEDEPPAEDHRAVSMEEMDGIYAAGEEW